MKLWDILGTAGVLTVVSLNNSCYGVGCLSFTKYKDTNYIVIHNDEEDTSIAVLENVDADNNDKVIINTTCTTLEEWIDVEDVIEYLDTGTISSWSDSELNESTLENVLAGSASDFPIEIELYKSIPYKISDIATEFLIGKL